MSAVPANLQLANPWRHALPALLLLWGVLLLLYRDTAVAMVEIWSRSDTFAHAFLVPPIALWLAWRRRHMLALLTPRPQPWILLPMAAFGLLWLMGELVTVNAATQFALVAMLVLAVPAVLGMAVARELMFPLGFMFFAVPIGEFMTPTMIAWTADATVLALRWTGIPVYREGMQFIIPSGQWSVVEACSGVRYLIASFMVGTLFAYLNYRSTKRRLLFVGVSILVPIVANWMRAYMIVMLGHLSGNTIAVGADHLIFGWVFFGVIIMIMFLIGARWSEPDDTPVAARVRLPVDAWPNVKAGAFAGMLLACMTVVVVPRLASGALQQTDAGAAAPRLVLPSRLGDWQATNTPIAPWQPRYVNPSVEALQAYASGDRVVGVYVGYYRGQGPDRKLVSSQNMLVGSQDPVWNNVANGKRQVQSPAEAVTMRTAELRGSRAVTGPAEIRLAVRQVYWIDGRLVAGDMQAKAFGALQRLAGRGDDGAVLIIYTKLYDGVDAEAVLDAFVRENMGLLQAQLRAASASSVGSAQRP
jgi:exosortase A